MRNASRYGYRWILPYGSHKARIPSRTISAVIVSSSVLHILSNQNGERECHTCKGHHGRDEKGQNEGKLSQEDRGFEKLDRRESIHDDLDEGQRTKEKRQASISVISSYRNTVSMLYEERQLKFNDSTQLAFNQYATSIGLCPSCIFISPTNFFSQRDTCTRQQTEWRTRKPLYWRVQVSRC